MNELLSLTTKDERELALARLIDDELTAAQERELLKHLDAQPELWRHCALGFLEDRALRRGARGWVMAQDSATSATQPAPAVLELTGTIVPQTVKKRRTWLDYMTVAAGLLLAFVGGLIVQQNQPRPLPGNNTVATGSPANTAQTHVPTTPVPLPQESADPEQTAVASDDSPSNLRLQYVNHTGEPSSKQIDVPLIPVSNIDENMLDTWEQATPQNSLPPETQRWLEQEGQVVRQQNMWLRVDLPNGQQALVPVQRIMVQPRHLLAQ